MGTDGLRHHAFCSHFLLRQDWEGLYVALRISTRGLSGPGEANLPFVRCIYWHCPMLLPMHRPEQIATETTCSCYVRESRQPSFL